MPRPDAECDLRHVDHRRRRPRRRTIGYIVLASGLVIGAFTAMPAHDNPLVRLGWLVVPDQVDDAPIVMIATTIPVQSSDLPAQRPSLSVARSVDEVEAAHIVGGLPDRTVGLVEADTAQPDAATMSTEPSLATSVALPVLKAPLPPAQPQTVPPKKQPGVSGPDEDFTELKKRVFNSER